jgi:hypothetical protein
MIDADSTRGKMTSPACWTSELKQELFMILAVSWTTLIANICGLIMAFVVVAQGAYIVHECFGYYRPQDAPAFFAPAIVMLIVRNRIFSCAFLTLYVALLIQMFYQTRLIHVVPGACGGKDDPLGYMALFFVLSIICLAIYAVVVLIRFIIFLFSADDNDGADERQEP